MVYPTDPDWYPLARFENDLLVVFASEAAHLRHEIPPDEGGRYRLANIGRWFMSAPARTAARIAHELGVLGDLTRREPRPGETLGTCGPATLRRARSLPDRHPRATVDPGVPARDRRSRGRVLHDPPRPRPDDYPQVYLDGHTLVRVDQHLRVLDNYLPWRIDPDPEGNYAIDGDEWTFHLVQGTAPAPSTT